MKKLLPWLGLMLMTLSACSTAPVDVGNGSPTPTLQPAKYPSVYEMDCGDGCVKPKLEILSEKDFRISLNLCHGMVDGEGTYSIDSGKYAFQVDQCTSCDEKSDLGLPTVRILMEPVGNGLLITSPVTRTDGGQVMTFCAPNHEIGFMTFFRVK